MNFKSPSSSTTSTWHLVLVSVGAILIVVTTIDIYMRVLPPDANTVIASKTMPKCPPTTTATHSIPPQHDSPNPGDRPQRDTIGTVFRELEALEDLGAGGDLAWDSIILPDKGGYVYVKSNDSAAGPEPWGVGMFHSLHCLVILRAVIQESQGVTTGEKMDDDHDHLTRRSDIHVAPDHFKHCLSYLAQSIICAADGTLEPPHIAYDANGHITEYTVDGIGVWHQCKDTSVLWKKVLESEEEPFDHWDFKRGDTIESLWGWN
ncbi:hypothetical protein VTN77DRAFT_6286 [Rasamsonia byssochlamydoides]|uniref:uncharacterized protein n=1 Tax=Rasamsonia byssochlamydoides TaxID=89139 RepID=UPI0037421857